MVDTLKSGYWYEVKYADNDNLVFKFLGNSNSGNITGLLCNGTEQEINLNRPYKDIIEHGLDSPCT